MSLDVVIIVVHDVDNIWKPFCIGFLFTFISLIYFSLNECVEFFSPSVSICNTSNSNKIQKEEKNIIRHTYASTHSHAVYIIKKWAHFNSLPLVFLFGNKSTHIKVKFMKTSGYFMCVCRWHCVKSMICTKDKVHDENRPQFQWKSERCVTTTMSLLELRFRRGCMFNL